MPSLKYRKKTPRGVDGLKTGKEVIERALCLLGYAGVGSAGGAWDPALLKRAAAAVSQIYHDLSRLDKGGDTGLCSMDEEIKLSPETVNDVMPYGVAMLVAQSEGDWDSQALFSAIYSKKRCSVPRNKARIADVLPGGGQ